MTSPALSRDDRAFSHKGDFLGHPRGLSVLFATEMWERFSFYGMRALLLLYMTNHLLQPREAERVIGLRALRTALEAPFGPLGLQPLASQLYGLYTALVYLTPIFGGLLADRWLGQRRTVVLGAALMAAGHFAMAFEPLFLFALLLLILGNGAFKPNVSTQVGALYAPGDPRRDRAYSVFYVGINLGAFLAPLVCGTLGEEVGWHYGFAAAGGGMTLGLFVYLWALPRLPPDAIARAPKGPRAPLTGEERRGLGLVLLLFVPVTLFWAAYEQSGNTIALWAEGFTDRGLDLFAWRTEIPVTWFQALNPLMIFVFTPLVVGFWAEQARRGAEPSTRGKMARGCFALAAAYLLLALAAWTARDEKASALWLVGFFAVLTLGELYVSPVGLSLVSKAAPLRMLSMIMGLWLATSFTGNFLAGLLGSLWSGMAKGRFFVLIAALAGLAGALIALSTQAWPGARKTAT